MSSPLVALPTELLECIVLELPTTSDLCSLRAVCHELEAKTFNVFGRLHFSSRHHMISLFSLQALIDISNHQGFAPFVRRIIFGTDQLTEHFPEFLPGKINEIDNHYQLLSDQEHIKQTGLHLSMITIAFRNFKNCHALKVQATPSMRSHGNHDQSFRRSYGAMTIYHATGHLPNTFEWHSPPVKQPPLRLFPILLSAAQMSGLQLHSFELSVSASLMPLKAKAFALPSWNLQCFSPVLSALEVFKFPFEPPIAGLPPYEIQMIRVSQFLSFACNLHTLEIHFPSRSCCNITFHNISKHVTLPKLSTLSLKGFTATEDAFLRFVKTFKSTLLKLHLWGSELYRGAWSSALSRMGETFRLLSLSLRNIMQHHHRVAFKPCEYHSDPSKPLLTCIVYDAPTWVSMQEFLLNLPSRIIVVDNAYYAKYLDL